MPKSEMQQWIEQADSNADAIKKEIEILSSDHWDFSEQQCRKFWTRARKISDLFKTLEPLLEGD